MVLLMTLEREGGGGLQFPPGHTHILLQRRRQMRWCAWKAGPLGSNDVVDDIREVLGGGGLQFPPGHTQPFTEEEADVK
jgi:hypothetical protein